MKNQKFACFDVFDTVLFRAVLAPSDVFRIVYMELIDAGILNRDTVCEDAFVGARRNAEATVRVGVEECTLEQIWNKLTEYLGENCAQLGAELEEKAERDVLYPNAEIVDSLHRRRKNGERVIFVSDMYLSTQFLQSVLESFEIWHDGDIIFVSSDEGAQKRTGRLYKKVRDQLGGNPRDYHMTGDNRRSDVLRARLAGWRARHYQGGELNQYERSLVNSLQMDALPKSALIGLIRKYRCGTSKNKISRYASDFLGISSFLWALWAIRTAEVRGVTTLKFAARDGYQAWVAARALKVAEVTDVESDYFYCSRTSIYYATIQDLEKDIDWFSNRTSNLTPRKLFKNLRLNSADAIDILGSSLNLDAVLSDAELGNLNQQITNSDLACKILEGAKEQRALATEYLNQQGMLCSESWALVDIGWHLNVQSKIANLTGVEHIKGLYLYLSETRVPRSESGMALAMIPAKFGDERHRALPQIFKGTTVAEHLLGMAPHGTTLSYARDAQHRIVPVHKAIGASEAAGKELITKEVRRFAEDNAAFLSRLFITPESCAEGFLRITNAFLDRPTKAALSCLPELLFVGEGLQNEDDIKLLKPIGLSDIGTALLVLMRIKRRGNFEWLSGRLVMSGPLASPGILLAKLLKRQK